jgi:hypothetical protein
MKSKPSFIIKYIRKVIFLVDLVSPALLFSLLVREKSIASVGVFGFIFLGRILFVVFN